MKMEELVFRTDRGTAATDSWRVAVHTGRAHKNIRKSCRRLIAQGYGDCFREEREGGRNVFVMNRAGFCLVTRTLPGIDEWRRAASTLFDGGQAQEPAAITRPAPPETPEQALEVVERDGRQCISAKLLHAFLQVGRDFSTWFKYRTEQYDLLKGVDFDVVKVATNLGNTVAEYILTLDTAKELCMVENNERGKVARRYFIEAEKRFRQMTRPAAPSVPKTFAEALRLAACQAEHIEAMRKRIDADAPKVAFADAIITSPCSCGIDELAKILAQNGVQTGEIRLFGWMRENGFLCGAGTAYNQPTQKALEQGLFELVPKTWTHPRTGETMTTTRTMVTGKGRQYFINRFLYNQKKTI